MPRSTSHRNGLGIRIGLRIATPALLFALVVVLPWRSHSAGEDRPHARVARYSGYRTPGKHHKAIVYSYQNDIRNSLLSSGASILESYGAFDLYDVMDNGSGVLEKLSAESGLRDDLNLITLREGAIDTTTVASTSGDEILKTRTISGRSAQLAIVQMIGPIKPKWRTWLETKGEVVCYLPNDAYLVKLHLSVARDVRPASSGGPRFVRWVGPYKPSYKMAPELARDAGPLVSVTVQLLNTPRLDGDIDAIESLSESEIGEAEHVLKYVNLRVRVDRANLPTIASMPDVIWIEPLASTKALDERQGEIIAGNFSANEFLSTDYLSWLESKDLTGTPHFLVDIADSGIDTGDITAPVLHKVFLDASGQSRISYAQMAAGAPDGPVNDTTGHGTLNASILGGYDQSTSFPDADEQGLRFGLGIDPFARLGVTKVFNPGFVNPDYSAMVQAMYAAGARISSNSWGAQVNYYTTVSQTYDAMVRDADPATKGNQQITVVFAAGNGGAGGNIDSPGTAKNAITVGASQNYRPDGTDGCGVTPSGASDIELIIGFSSGGPVQDGRIKPDLVAPGTHVEGALSQDPGNTTRDLCGPKFEPDGQTLYTWSSGTSQATPAVAGAASLAFKYFEQSTGSQPSPAMVKAFLLNSTDYMSGTGAGFNLPGANQGWGRLDLGRAFDGVPRTIIDQTQLLTATGQTYTLHAHVADPTKEVRVTLAWTDAPGSVVASPIVNDLDLQVSQGGQTYLGNNFLGAMSLPGGAPDKLNNVEAVWLTPGHDGEIVATVVAANLAGDGVPGNSNPVDQDFALVVYNATPDDGSIDSPPDVALTYPVGGETLVAGNFADIQWTASDDHGIQSQEVELSTDGGVTFQRVAQLDGKARNLAWQVPAAITSQASIQIRVFDGANLPVAAVSPGDFSIVNGPPDTAPPTVQLLSPGAGALIGGGTSTMISWQESDNVGVLKRVLEFSPDAGKTYQPVATINGPIFSSGPQSYQWQVTANLSAKKGRLRITVYDGAGNSAQSVSTGKIRVWALPAISNVTYRTSSSGQGELTVTGSKFRAGQAQVFVDDTELNSLTFQSAAGGGTFNKIISDDEKLNKEVPVGVTVNVTVRVALTGQVSAPFPFVRNK